MHKCPKAFQDMLSYLRNYLSWCPLLRVLIENYMFSSFAVHRQFSANAIVDRNTVNQVLAILTIVYLVVYPIWILYFLRKNMLTLYNQAVKNKYETVYLNVDYFKKSALAFTTIWLVR